MKFFYDFPTKDRIIFGANIDNGSEVSESDVIKALQRAKEENKLFYSIVIK